MLKKEEERVKESASKSACSLDVDAFISYTEGFFSNKRALVIAVMCYRVVVMVLLLATSALVVSEIDDKLFLFCTKLLNDGYEIQTNTNYCIVFLFIKQTCYCTFKPKNDKIVSFKYFSKLFHKSLTLSKFCSYSCLFLCITYGTLPYVGNTTDKGAYMTFNGYHLYYCLATSN